MQRPMQVKNVAALSPLECGCTSTQNPGDNAVTSVFVQWRQRQSDAGGRRSEWRKPACDWGRVITGMGARFRTALLLDFTVGSRNE